MLAVGRQDRESSAAVLTMVYKCLPLPSDLAVLWPLLFTLFLPLPLYGEGGGKHTVVKTAQSLVCTGLALEGGGGGCFLLCCISYTSVLTWQYLLVSFRITRSVTEGRGEPGQSIFSRACSGTRQTAGQRQLSAVVFLTGVFAAFQAVSEQLPLSADDSWVFPPFPPPPSCPWLS